MLNDSNIFAGIYIHNCILCYNGNHLMYILHIHLLKNSIVNHSIYYINHVQLVYMILSMSDIPLAGVQRLMWIYASALWVYLAYNKTS